MSYIKQNGSLERVCAYREPDATVVAGQEIGLRTAKTGGISEGTDESALALGGRSPALLISREFLYRACELAMNLNADKNTSIAIYQMFLDFTMKVIQNEHDQGSATASTNTENQNTSSNVENQDENSDNQEDTTQDSNATQ